MKIVWQILAACWRRNRAWLAAFVAIWLVALCIPPVRQLLMFDLFGSSILRGSPAPFADRERNPAEEFDFKKLPSQDLSTRFAALIQQNYNYGLSSYANTRVQMPLPQIVVKTNNSLFNPKALAVPGGPPGSPATVVVPPAIPTIAPPKPPPGNPQAEADKLIQDYPQEAWLIAHRLRQTLSWMQDNRFAGLYEWRPIRPMPIPTVIPEKKPAPPYFTPQQWNKTFALAKQGQQLEPDNAFFDTVLIYLYLAAYRDEDAIRVLTSAVNKKRFDNHRLSEWRTFNHAHEKVRPVLLEEKFQISPPHYDNENFTRIGTLLSWQAWKWERVGKRIEGLELRHKIALLGYLSQKGSSRSSVNYLTRSLQNQAYKFHPWQFPTTPPATQPALPKKLIPKSPEALLWKNHSDAINFMLTARELRQEEIARDTLRLAQKREKQEKLAQNDTSIMSSISERDYVLMEGWHELRLAFLVQVVVMLGASCVLGFFLIGSHFASTPLSAIVASTRWSLALVILCAIAFLQLTIRQQSVFSSFLYGGINMSLGACVIAPIIISALYAWICAMKQLRQLRRTSDETTIEKRDILSVGISWSFFVTTIAAIISWLMALYSLNKIGTLTLPFLRWNSLPVVISDDPEALFIIGAVLFAAIYVAWFFTWRAFTPKTLQPLLHGALRAHRNALSAFALCSASLYVLSILLSLPHRNAMNQKFEDYLQGKSTQQIAQRTE